jgi:hypothetical protein
LLAFPRVLNSCGMRATSRTTFDAEALRAARESGLVAQRIYITGLDHDRHFGISIIYQELRLVPFFSVAKNMVLGHSR